MAMMGFHTSSFLFAVIALLRNGQHMPAQPVRLVAGIISRKVRRFREECHLR